MLKSSYILKKNPYTLFIFKLTVLYTIVFVLDFSIGNILRYFYFKQQRGSQYLATYAIEKTRANVLIFGSSRASHHYRPDVFEKCLHLSCFNVGSDGTPIFYHYGVLKGILKRYSPEIVILDFVKDEFKQDQQSYDAISTLLPYYKCHPEMHPVIELKSPYEKLKLLSFIYPYNSSPFIIAGGNSMFTNKRREDIEGYIPLMKIWNSPIQIEESAIKYKIDSIKVKIYRSFIKDCINSKVKLYIICSPYFIKSNYVDYSLKLGKEIAKIYNVAFFDYSRDSIFISNSKLFADTVHLNDEGAKVFSNIVIDDISKTVKP